MAFCITVGTHGTLNPPISQNTTFVPPSSGEAQTAKRTSSAQGYFTGQLQGYEGVTAQCHNCGNWSAHCITEWPFFTICFLPLIPLATHKYKLVACPICRFKQDLSTRPDVQSQHPGAGPVQQGGPGSGYGGPPGQGQPGQGQPGLQAPMGGGKPIAGTYS